MIIPEYLRQGDVVAIAAPARKISQEEVAPAVQLLEQHGFVVKFDDRLFAEDHQFAGRDAQRAAYFQELLDDPDVKAIWCARGGYGSVRIIDQLDFTRFCRKPKWMCGYSDVTVFHSHIQRNYDIATLHATMPINVHTEDLGSVANLSFIAALKGEPLRYTVPAHPLNRPGDFEAPLTGGNLSILYALCGSPSDADTRGKVLFIEDLDEYLYHIDRMITNLERNGKLRHIAGMVIGHLSDMHDNTIPYGKTAEEIVAEHCHRYDFPVIFGFPAGHESDNRALRLGCPLKCHFDGHTVIIEN